MKREICETFKFRQTPSTLSERRHFLRHLGRRPPLTKFFKPNIFCCSRRFYIFWHLLRFSDFDDFLLRFPPIEINTHLIRRVWCVIKTILYYKILFFYRRLRRRLPCSTIRSSRSMTRVDLLTSLGVGKSSSARSNNLWTETCVFYTAWQDTYYTISYFDWIEITGEWVCILTHKIKNIIIRECKKSTLGILKSEKKKSTLGMQKSFSVDSD